MDREWDSDSPTFIGDSHSNSPPGTPEQSAPPGSDTNPSPAQSPSDAPIQNAGPKPIPPSFSDAPTMIDAGGSRGLPPPRSAKPAEPSSVSWQLPTLVPGTLLGGRYEILETVGEGGMGAVYKAEDRELGRTVALKVIRPELARDPDILQRFKQEILLASRVTDRNIIRIYDLGDAEGIKFITMEFVAGDDLRHLLHRQGKLPPSEAVDIMEQVVSGLAAAHSVGVIHRDLKPGNIMRATDGRVLVMDFGLARSLAGDGMTRSGTMLGTMEYMSPEQAQAKELDARSDIFTIGLITYELLTGIMPYQAESAIASLLKRTQQRAIPVSDIDKNLPGALSNIVSKCLERDPALRYQSASELLNDLRVWQGKSGGSARVAASSIHMRMNRLRELPWSRIGPFAFLLVVMLAATAWYFSRRANTTVVGHSPVSVLVADFQNNTSDSLFDDTLEPMFNLALEGASFINAYNRGAARQLAGKLPNPTSKLDEQAARLVAVSQGVNAIVTGSLSLRGDGYRLSVEAIDAVTGKSLASGDISAANKDDLLLDIPKLVAPIRKALGDNTPESVQLAATQGSFAAGNIEAVHQYSIGMEQQSAGKTEDALKSFTKASELDPNFARAYAGMSAAAGNLGQMQDAEKYAKQAMAHIDRMTERERYRVRGLYYIRAENWQKCVEEYSDLTKQYPADDVGLNNLSACYARLLNMQKAMEVAQRQLQIAPKDAMARMNLSLYACYATDFQSCEREARAVLQISPSYEGAFLALAYAQLGQNQVPQATETYQKLEKVSATGATFAASGLGNIALYQGKVQQAIQILEKGAAADLAAKSPDAAADKYLMIAEGNLLRGSKPAAVAAAERALANAQSLKVQFLAARIFAEAGESAKAGKLAASLGSGLKAEPQAYGKLILGESALNEHDPKHAIQLFTEARGLLDTWIGRFDLGRAYLEAGEFAEADSEFDTCLKRRGEVVELFQDNMPTYSLLPVVYYDEGRVREGLKSPGFADSYRTYLGIRGESTEDPLVPDIRRRLKQ
jgi:serine/threonine protein kinase/Tfp pilus assembly protein PilF